LNTSDKKEVENIVARILKENGLRFVKARRGPVLQFLGDKVTGGDLPRPPEVLVIGNLDGGAPDTNYGTLIPHDGGTP
jgi:hypothetical protein